jgi:glutamate N-acetyltransferase/amino-acid N-acetyltransferase
MAQLTSAKFGIDPHEVVVASTGVIGTFLPMDRIARGIEEIQVGPEGGLDFARAIMTTDTKPKHVAVRANGWSMGGVVKGVGMIHPNMATMLCFITTDASVTQPFLAGALKKAVDDSFNMIDIDSDTSPDDTVVVMANGLAGGEPIDDQHGDADTFRAALRLVCTDLAKQMVADAEGATKVIQARVEGAASREDARKAAREIVMSLGVKTAVYGQDPNWGRIISAVGNSGAAMKEQTTALYLSNPDGKEVCLYSGGVPQDYDPVAAKACLAPRDVRMRLTMGLGESSATAWGSDLTEDYVRLNSLYTT